MENIGEVSLKPIISETAEAYLNRIHLLSCGKIIQWFKTMTTNQYILNSGVIWEVEFFDKITGGNMRAKVSLFIVFFVFSCLIFPKKVTTFDEIGKPNSITVDKNQIFIVEGSSIYIYSLKNFNLQKKIGKEGEGPKEFKGNITLYVLPDYLHINSIGRLSFFTREGEFKNEVKLEKHFFELYPFQDGFIGMTQSGLSIYSGNMNKVKYIRQFKEIPRPGIGRNKINPIVAAGPDGGTSGAPVYDNKFFLKNNGTIEIFEKSGNKIDRINLKIEKVKVTENDKKRYLTFFKTHPNTRANFEMMKKMFEFPKYFPLIRNQFYTDNRIYIRTYKMRNGQSEFYIFDLKGKLLKKLFLPIVEMNALDKNPYTIKNSKVYQLVSSDDGDVWELHVTEIK